MNNLALAWLTGNLFEFSTVECQLPLRALFFAGPSLYGLAPKRPMPHQSVVDIILGVLSTSTFIFLQTHEVYGHVV